MTQLKRATILLLPLCVAASSVFTACAPKAVRGGPGTDNPNIDDKAMSTTLDREDLDYLVDENLNAMFASPFWARDVQAAPEPPVIAIWPIKNATSEHIEGKMLQLLSSLETTFVNGGAVQVVSRERQAEMAAEVGVQNTDTFNPAMAAKLGAQIGAKYFVTGKLTSVDERGRDGRRQQYALFLQVIEVETSMIKFQYESGRTKAIQR